MKTLFIFNDTETTGLVKKDNKFFSPFYKEQALSYALVVYDKDECVCEEEVKIKLKQNVLPNPKALLINNINPFSKEFLAEAKSEYEGAHYLAQKILAYKAQGYRTVFIAYNAEFDKNIFSDMLKRSGINFEALFDALFDPLLMTRPLVKDGKIKTREIENYGKKYNSASLEDVYNGLGFSSASVKAHNALEDTKMLKSVVYKAYFLFTGKHFDEVEVDSSTFVVGAEKTVGVLEDFELKIKNIKILKTSPMGGRLLVLDSEKIKEHPDKVKSCIVEVKLNSILDEYDTNYEVANTVESFYNKYQSVIDEVVAKNELPDMMFATHEELYFGAIEKLAEKKLADPKASLTEQEEEKLEWAEEYAYARFDKGWSTTLYGQNYENAQKTFIIDDEHTLILDPVGKFLIKKGDSYILDTEKKTEVTQFLVNSLNMVSGSDEYKRINAILVPVKNFKSVKYPAMLIEEFNKCKTDVFSGSNKFHKDMMTDLKNFYQTVNKEAFKDLTIPNFKMNLNLFKK